ncbi:Ribonuclease 3 [Trichinella spiralis]|uniref:Ribonuclease 3 n=1 Tax=Trichinella spiralis TaxID=6334 RepID=A0A0V1BKM5_TRISP|nr:Ribonuclease 3 [Trichinella spiralis]
MRTTMNYNSTVERKLLFGTTAAQMMLQKQKDRKKGSEYGLHGYPAEENDHKSVIVLMPFTRSSCHAQLSSFLSSSCVPQRLIVHQCRMEGNNCY